MIPKEILKQIRHIEIRSGRLVNEIFAGAYSSVFKGQGMEFSEVREYIPGDDVRSIDWNVTARYGKPFVKKFTEERELTVIFLVDASGSQKFGTRGKFKSEVAAEIASILAFSAIRNNDRVGMVMFTDQIEKVILPKKGRNHILRLIREILYFKSKGRKTNISLVLQYLNELWKRKAVVFLISDFFDLNFEHALRITEKKHDLIAVEVSDERESELPKSSIIEAEDPETGEVKLIDASDPAVILEYKKQACDKEEKIKDIFKKAKADFIQVSTDKPYVDTLMRFFKKRAKKASRI